LPNVAQFPDSVTSRGAKHLRELSKEVKKGNRGIMFYLVNRMDCELYKTAEHIDVKYKEAFDEAIKCGVEVLIYKSEIVIDKDNNCKIQIGKKLKFKV
jgi:sugar fermentation stimulation protein A